MILAGETGDVKSRREQGFPTSERRNVARFYIWHVFDPLKKERSRADARQTPNIQVRLRQDFELASMERLATVATICLDVATMI